MTAPIYGNDPDVRKLANLHGRMGRVEHRPITTPWVTPALLNGVTDVGGTFAPFGYRINLAGLDHDWRGRLANVTDGMVVCNVAAKWRLGHDYERPTVAESGGVRSAASISYDDSTGDVTVYLL